ncbi:2-nitropropane dioxygenase [Amycolatopsis albispora]|uniref:Propionate 3-nitronate monooxygenase n=2 Tax=Amycolatopsis albispora TaxID=1804986 RepID=A0A344LJL5_9PSEU|nr:2-nitropropane dioxygenase [Amycolatopsis albispora]
MAGGPTTPRLVIAAAEAGGAGVLAGGYKSAEALAAQLGEVRAAGVPFGVNLFAPNPVPVDPGEYDRYRNALQPEADRLGVDLTGIPVTEDDDAWRDKVDLLLADPVPLATFTFGLPDRAVIRALRAAGTVTGQTVTTAAEAEQATAAGVDLLVVQGAAAGGHSGTLSPDRLPVEKPLADLVREVAGVTRLPIVAAGGLTRGGDVADVLHAGAVAVMVGTVLLLAGESGASATHRAALGQAGPGQTVLTRAFTGRPARALRNAFTDRFTATAPAGYPALHHLTSPLRKAAAAAGDADRLHLWAGTGYPDATAEPAADILRRLSARL